MGDVEQTLMDAPRDGRRSLGAYARWSATAGIYALPPASRLPHLRRRSCSFASENGAFAMPIVRRCGRSLSISVRAHLMHRPRCNRTSSPSSSSRRIKWPRGSNCRRRRRSSFACRLVQSSLISDGYRVTTLRRNTKLHVSVERDETSYPKASLGADLRRSFYAFRIIVTRGNLFLHSWYPFLTDLSPFLLSRMYPFCRWIEIISLKKKCSVFVNIIT